MPNHKQNNIKVYNSIIRKIVESMANVRDELPVEIQGFIGINMIDNPNPTYPTGKSDLQWLSCQLLICLDATRGLPSIDHRQRKVHQDQVRLLLFCHRDPGFTIRGANHLVLIFKQLN